MEQETLFHVGAVIIEAAVLLRLSLWLSSFGLHGLRSSVEKLRAWWGRRANVTEARQMEQQTALELDVLRCRVTCQMWNVLLALALLRFVSGQVLAALRLPRLFPEFDVSFFFLAVVGLTLNCKPSLITPKSLDAWHVVTHVIWNASILVAREIDVRDVILFTFATRFMFLVLAKRTWCFLLCALVTCSNMGFMALRQGEARLADGQDSLFVILYALLPGLVAIVFARKLLEENATLKLDLKSRQVELGAVSSLLTVCYDAVAGWPPKTCRNASQYTERVDSV
ncbi:unnamed protein product [Durusdinium trenchii]|uniref:Derlin n=1 Tax=Durusdinium trenchii TaxID=1381693 RepID=A0ABP0QFU1_9DINO